MIKKSITRKKKSLITSDIHEIQNCIRQDYGRLEKAYPKALSTIEKELIRLKKEKIQAKAKTKAVTQSSKRGKSSHVKSSDTNMIDRQITALLVEKEEVKADLKKFNAQKKIWQQFEKDWTKKFKKTSRTKQTSATKTRRKPARKTARKTTRPSQPTFTAEQAVE